MALDSYEGFPSMYIKREIEIETPQGNIKAFAYVMTTRYETMPAEPSENYYAVIAQGYEENGIPLDALDDAYGESVQEVGGGL